MRYPASTLFVPLALLLAGPITAASADDDLFLPGYRPYTKVAATSAPAPPATPAAAPAAPEAPARKITITVPRLTLPRLGGRSKTPMAPVEAPLPTATSGPTVASTLSVVAPPDYVPLASRGVISRLRRPEPEVPPGLPRGAEPRPMIPPEPLEPSPALAQASERPTDLRDPLTPARPSTDGAARTSLAAHPAAPRTISPFAPVRPRLEDDIEPTPGLARRQATMSIPPMIARPADPESDVPLRRVRATANDLDP